MKKIIIIAGFSLLLSSCGFTTIPPGYVGIKVNQWGTDKGVSSYPIMTGRVTYNPVTEDIIEYPVFTKTASWTLADTPESPGNEEITFNSKDGLTFASDVSFSYQIIREQAPYFYVKFRENNLDKFTHGFLRNVARDVINEVSVQYSDDEIIGPGKEKILNECKERLNKILTPIGVSITQFGFLGAIRPPRSLQESMIAKQQAIQLAIQAENELRTARAEAAKIVASAEGTAKANKTIADSIAANPQIIRWRELDLQQQAIQKWAGQMPTYMGSNGQLPFIMMGGK